MPPVAHLAIQTSGLKELVRGLKGGEERLDKEIRAGVAALAKDVAADAKGMAANLTPKVPARVIGSISGRAQAASADIKLGSNSVPFALGWEFGARHNVERTTAHGPMLGWNQFPQTRGRGATAGYFLYPAVRKHRDELFDKLLNVIEEVMGKAT